MTRSDTLADTLADTRPATQAARPPQLDALTGLRGIAAWFVVFYHIRLALLDLLPPSAIGLLAKGYLAVDLFFMLSGFVMWLNYGHRFARVSQIRAGYLGFMRKRIARVWPLHVAVLAAMVAFVAVLAATGRPVAGYPVAELGLHVLLVQNWGLTDTLSWNHPAWSISAEMGAYLLFPVLALVLTAILSMARARPAIPVLSGLPILLPILLLALLLLALHAYFAALGHAGLGADIPATGLLRCILEFAIGMVCATIWQRAGSTAHHAWRWALVAVLAGGAALLFRLPETAWVPAALTGILMTVASGTGALARALSHRWLLWLGETSYAVYLTHFFGFIVFKIVYVGADGQLGAGTLALFVLLVAAVSHLAYRRIEKPAQRLLNGRAAPVGAKTAGTNKAQRAMP